jgi:hypothetical protein
MRRADLRISCFQTSKTATVMCSTLPILSLRARDSRKVMHVVAQRCDRGAVIFRRHKPRPSHRALRETTTPHIAVGGRAKASAEQPSTRVVGELIERESPSAVLQQPRQPSLSRVSPPRSPSAVATSAMTSDRGRARHEAVVGVPQRFVSAIDTRPLRTTTRGIWSHRSSGRDSHDQLNSL